MTTFQKISAGFYDQTNAKPVYTGDVYREKGCICPFHMVVKTESGFKVAHIGSDEKFDFIKTIGKVVEKYCYYGNYFEDKENFDIIFNEQNYGDISRYFHDRDAVVSAEATTGPKDDHIANSGEMVENETIVAGDGGVFTVEETVEGTVETITETETEPESDTVTGTVEETVKETVEAEIPEDVKEFLEGNADELPEGTEVISEAEAEELEKQAKEIEETAKAETETESDTHNTTPETDKEKKSNVVTLEVVASNKEEKRLIERRNDYTKAIESLKRKNEELETEAVKFENLASTLKYQPFIELKSLVSNAVQDYAKKQDIKECEKHLKNYKSIDSMEKLLEDYVELADKDRENIELNNKQIDDYEIKLTEINDKLRAFQFKLPLGLEDENSAKLEVVKEETKGTTPEKSEE